MNSATKGLATKTVRQLNIGQIDSRLESAVGSGVITEGNRVWITARVKACIEEVRKFRSLLSDFDDISDSAFSAWSSSAGEVSANLKDAKRNRVTWLQFGHSVESFRIATEKERLLLFDLAVGKAHGIIAKALDSNKRILGIEKQSSKHLEAVEKCSESASESLVSARESYVKAKNIANWSEKRKDQIAGLVSSVNQAARKVAKSEESISESEQKASDHASATEELRIQIEGIRAEMGTLLESSDADLSDASESLKLLTASLKETDQSAKDILFKATSARFVETWETRREALQKRVSFKQNLVYIAVAVTVILGVVGVIALYSDTINWINFLLAKLVVAPPLIFLIWFTSNQYSKERAMEAEYALKVNIGVSLEGYRVFMESLAVNEQSKEKVVDLFLAAIEKLYQPPGFGGLAHATTQKRKKKGHITLSDMDVNQLTELIKAVNTLKSLP